MEASPTSQTLSSHNRLPISKHDVLQQIVVRIEAILGSLCLVVVGQVIHRVDQGGDSGARAFLVVMLMISPINFNPFGLSRRSVPMAFATFSTASRIPSLLRLIVRDLMPAFSYSAVEILQTLFVTAPVSSRSSGMMSSDGDGNGPASGSVVVTFVRLVPRRRLPVLITPAVLLAPGGVAVVAEVAGGRGRGLRDLIDDTIIVAYLDEPTT